MNRGSGRGGPRASPTARTPTVTRGSRIVSARPRSIGHTTQPYAVIVGGGQGGIALGARLRQLRVPTIIVERNQRPGDSWRKRYKSLCLHDPVLYDHLPYVKFPPNWPVFSPKDKIRRLARDVHAGDGAQLLGLHDAKSAQTRGAGEWILASRTAGSHLDPRSSVADGMSGRPYTSGFPGRPLPTSTTRPLIRGPTHTVATSGRGRVHRLRPRLCAALGSTART